MLLLIALIVLFVGMICLSYFLIKRRKKDCSDLKLLREYIYLLENVNGLRRHTDKNYTQRWYKCQLELHKRKILIDKL